jgi:UDP-N-acetylmuramate--alanine ligase
MPQRSLSRERSRSRAGARGGGREGKKPVLQHGLLGNTRRIHFVGIGGIGMSGIAELLANLGYTVTGSDAKRSEITERLASRFGLVVHEGHATSNVGDADVVVVTSAVKLTNPEILQAQRRKIPVIPRAEMLAELMRLRFSIAVAGAHGKTTTTSMIALGLERAGLDPTAVIGGRLSAFGSNARLGRGEYMVVEADESDRSFLMLWPAIAVITNIDHEHMESYGSFADLQQAFADFANKAPFYGGVVACADDEHLAPVLARVKRRLVTYGLENADADVVGTDIQLGGFGGRCIVHRHRESGTFRLGELRIPVPGRHNLLNALAAVAVAEQLGVEFPKVVSALEEFHGAERRFQRHGEHGGVLVIDDYGHHPTEIAAVLAAAKSALGRRLIVAFQPHRYTRTQQLMASFGPALREADEIVLTDIYAASEEPIEGVTIEALADSIRSGAGKPVRLAKQLDEVVRALVEIAKPGDAVITLGAGSIGGVPTRLADALDAMGGRG